MGTRISNQNERIRTALRTTRLFAAWPEPAFLRLCESAEMWRYAKGETVAEYGEEAKGLWLAAAGSFANSRTTAAGRYLMAGIQWPGDTTGIMPIFDGMPMPFSVVARTESLVVFMPRAVVMESLLDGKQQLLEVIALLCRRSRAEQELLCMKITDSVRCQLAKLLCYMPRGPVFPVGEPVGFGKIDPAPMHITQDELAAMIGVSRQTINGELAPLIREGIVVREGNSLRVAKFKELLAVMEEDEPLPTLLRAVVLSWDEKLRQT